ncbi:MAG: kinase [Asticcacaulis sp.]
MTGSPDLAESAVLKWLEGASRPLFVGVCGSQGSGKSTLCEGLERRLGARGLRVAVLSLDDLYLSPESRGMLAHRVHPLLATRGVPGTHDVALGGEVFQALKNGKSVRLPRFDKANDTPFLKAQWPLIDGPVDVVLFEGWAVGAVAETDDALDQPVNDLEAHEDPKGVWRAYVNTQLKTVYAPLFAQLDRLILLAAPSFEVVQGWRTQQEHDLKAKLASSGRTGARVMSDDQINRFIQHYERLTRHILREMPSRADLTLRLDSERKCIDVRELSA